MFKGILILGYPSVSSSVHLLIHHVLVKRSQEHHLEINYKY